MKTLKNFGLLASMVFATVLTFSCSSDDNGGGGSGDISGSYLHAKVDGTQFKAEVQGFSTVGASRIGTGEGQIISIIGGTIDGTNVSISLMGINTAGTYTLNPDSDSVMAFTTAGGIASYGTGICAGSTGTIIISTVNDEKIEGTFSFTGKDGELCSSTKMVTEGKFRGVFTN